MSLSSSAPAEGRSRPATNPGRPRMWLITRFDGTTTTVRGRRLHVGDFGALFVAPSDDDGAIIFAAGQWAEAKPFNPEGRSRERQVGRGSQDGPLTELHERMGARLEAQRRSER